MKTDLVQPIASRLLRAVIAKSCVEIVFVCAIATIAAFSNFSPLLRGTIDVADQTQVSGWVHDPLRPDEVIEVQLFINGYCAASRRADERRDDLVRAGATTKPHHGFTFRMDSLNLADGNYTVQVYAVRKTLSANKALIPITKTARTFPINH